MRLPFTLDPQVIHHIIHSQAGSIGKALIELIMNSVDAQAERLDLVVTQDGFSAQDNGNGFASREDIVQYFGRFGTPHEEGDATFGRFRLGRGQIMAHAVTVWQSQRWQMTVDTRTMGYAYELDDLANPFPGCSIAGTWYEKLGEMELYEVVQELRDLVRYTPLAVSLNGKLITRDPSKETWQHEDDVAYYRFHKEGSVAIYNQGVLVRYDPGAHWGAGGLIVSKKAIALNVSRTEILRKTCPVWKAIAQQGKILAQSFVDDPTARKGENARALAARQMKVATGDDLERLVLREAVFTALPGTRHLTLAKLLLPGVPITAMSTNDHWGLMQRGEAIAYSRQAMVLHPRTAERFECADAAELEEVVTDIVERLAKHVAEKPSCSWEARRLAMKGTPRFLPFSALVASFQDTTQVISDLRLPAELRRQWTALKWCLGNYASLAISGPEAQRYGNGLVFGHAHRLHIVLGESSVADAWTDGQTYIAIHRKEVEKLKSEGLRAAQRIFALVDHELAHAGDSLDATHDEAFFSRYHDLTLEHAHTKQFYLQQFSRKYMTSLGRGKPAGWVKREITVETRVTKVDGQGSMFELPSEGYPQQDAEPLSETAMACINATLGANRPAWDERELERQIVLEAQRQAEHKEEERQWEEEKRLIAEEMASCEPDYDDYPEDDTEFEAVLEAEHQADYEQARREAELGSYWGTRYQGHEPVEEALGRDLTEDEKHALNGAYNTFLVAHFIQSQGRFPQRQGHEDESYAWVRAGKAQHLRPYHWVMEERRANAVGLPLEEYLLSRTEDDGSLPVLP